MNKQLALTIVLVIAVCGMAFSGFLTYREMIAQTAPMCPSPGAAGTILGYPACVYGLAMYTIVAILSAWGLATKK